MNGAGEHEASDCGIIVVQHRTLSRFTGIQKYVSGVHHTPTVSVVLAATEYSCLNSQGPTHPVSVHILVRSSVLIQSFQAGVEFNGVLNDIQQFDATLPLLVVSEYIWFSHRAKFSFASQSEN